MHLRQEDEPPLLLLTVFCIKPKKIAPINSIPSAYNSKRKEELSLYFLWRNKPAAALGQDGKWISRGEIQEKLGQVRIFEDAGEARFAQRKDYSQAGVSVLNQKSFKEKAKIKALPVYKAVPAESPQKTAQKGREEPQQVIRPCIYGEYLEQLCEADNGQRTRVTFPPANLEATTNTPVVTEAASLLANIRNQLTNLDAREYQLREEIKRLDLLNSDRLHQIEMFELTDEECVTLVRAMHDSQVERRRRKNELLALLAEKDALSNIDGDKLKQAIRVIESLSDQIYRCRVLSESDPIVAGHIFQKGGQHSA